MVTGVQGVVEQEFCPEVPCRQFPSLRYSSEETELRAARRPICGLADEGIDSLCTFCISQESQYRSFKSLLTAGTLDT